MKFGLEDKTIKIINDYFGQNADISLVKIYGSRAVGNFRKGSDIDLVIFSNAEIQVSKIKNDLYELKTPYLFDVVLYSEIENEKLKREIDKNARIFYQNPLFYAS